MTTSSPEQVAPPSSGAPRRTPSPWLFALVVLALVLAAGGYVWWARARQAPAATGSAAAVALDGAAVLFTDVSDASQGRLAVASLRDPDGTRRLTDVRCDRVHYAAGRGLCLSYGTGFPPKTYANLFDEDLHVTGKVRVLGIPSRTRVSPDGRYGATTSFVTGHAYSDGSFSTSTVLIDMAAGKRLANLEDFEVVRDGRPSTARDTNIWGVTFAKDSNTFYATVSTAGHTYLAKGDVAARRLVMGRENVECPSLSPDGSRIGYKKRVDDGAASPVWRFHVLDLASGEDTELAEPRSIDDQLEWLDDDTVLYGDPESSDAVMALPADGSGAPRRFLSQARSPAVLAAALPDRALTGLAEGRPGRADLSVAVEPAVAGRTVTHTLRVTNDGPAPATRVFVEDELSGPATVVSAEGRPTEGISSYGCSVPDPARVRCDVSELPVGVTWTITVTITASGSGTVGGEVEVTAAEPDPDGSDDRATATTSVS